MIRRHGGLKELAAELARPGWRARADEADHEAEARQRPLRLEKPKFRAVLEVLAGRDHATTAEIVAETSLQPAAVRVCLADLIDAGVVERKEAARRSSKQAYRVVAA